MNSSENTNLTPGQFTLTLKSIIVGIEIMYLPNNVIRISKQDGWISCILGIVYPLYLVILANFMCKKFPKDNILILSKRCFGKFLGSILNIIFISFFLFMLTAELSGYSNVFRVYSVSFLKNYQVLLVTLLPIAYLAYNGIKPLGRLNEMLFYITIILVILPVAIFAYGSILNVMPVFGSGAVNIIKGAKETAFSYDGMEIIFLIYPFLQDNKKLLKCGLTCIGIVGFIYTWTTFATIYYLGIDIAPKYLWPVLSWADSIHIPFINSFRFIFLSVWSLVEYKCIATYYFAVSHGLSQSIKKVSYKTFILILYPIIICISLIYKNPTVYKYFINMLTPIYVMFNIFYVSIIAILISIKKGDACENS